MTYINYNKFKESLARLQERYNDYLQHKELEPFISESIKESCIQGFEICFDTSWKHLSKYLIQEWDLWIFQPVLTLFSGKQLQVML